MNNPTIFSIISAANFLGIDPLLQLGCAKVATKIKGKSPEEIKRILADDTDPQSQSSEHIISYLQ